MNALDINGTTPLHLALSTLKISATNNPNSDRKEELQQVGGWWGGGGGVTHVACTHHSLHVSATVPRWSI